MPGTEDLQDAVIRGDAAQAEAITARALGKGTGARLLLEEDLIPAMDEVGRRFEIGEYFLPELLIAARAMKAALALIQPLLAASDARPACRVAVGTVAGDLHDIGKNLVCAMLEGGGFEVRDLGSDVEPDRFVAAVREEGASIIGMSALLSTTMPRMAEVVATLRAAGLRDRVKIMIGGAPITQGYADRIGVDGYAPDASQAVALARRLRGDVR